jgi:hypothetical protein
MTIPHSDFRLTLRQLMIPISLLSLTVFLFLSFQTMQVLRDRDALNVAKGQQEQPYQDSLKLKAQLNALLIGTQKLTDEGNKSTKVITDKLKNLGIEIKTPPPLGAGVTAAPTQVPVAPEKSETGPVKP